MSVQDDLGRVVAEGLDCKVPENRNALISYLTICRNVSLRCQPSVREDGSLIIQFAPKDGNPASEVARLLSERTHMVQNRIVRLSPLPSLPEYPRGDAIVDAGQLTSRQMPDNGSRETRNVRCRGRGRGVWKIDQSAGLNSYSSGCGHGSRAEPQPSAWQSLPGHVVRISSYAEGRLNQEPTPASLYGNGRQLPSDQLKPSPTEPSTLSKRRRTEVPSSFCESVFQGTRDGLDIIRVQRLPPHATKEGLFTELQSRLKSAQSGLFCKFDLFHWDKSKGEARIHVNDMEAVFALWRTRHKSPLKYAGHVLSWDVAVSDTYEEKRILVEGLTQDITSYKLKLHIQSTECIPGHVQIEVILLEGKSKALIKFDDTIVDSSLVDELNEIGSEYEGSGETYTPSRLVYSLVPVPRSVQLSGLDSSIDKGTLRNYFNTLHRKVNMKRPLLVDEIQTTGNGFAVVGFRTVEDCNAVLALPEMPSLGSSDRSPAVELYSKYPKTETVESVSSDGLSATTSREKEAECAKAVEMTPDDPVVFDFIWRNSRYERKLKNALGCDELEWNGSTLSISKPSLREEEYKKKLEDFSDDFCCKKLRISDASLWERSLKLVEDEMATRSCEGKLIHSKEDLKMLFVGMETEINPLHQHFGNVFSAWRTQLEEETAEIQEVVSLPSTDHLDLLQRSASFGNFAEEVTVVKRRAGGKAYLDLKGPRNRVCSTKEQLWETIQTITSVHVAVDSRIIKFLNAVGLSKLNALYDDSNIAALAANCEDTSVRLLVFPGTRDVATSLAAETYDVVSVNSTEDDEVQKFMRSKQYNAFVVSLCGNLEVMMDPEFEDMESPEFEDIKESPKVVSPSVVGMAPDAATASERLESFLSENVVYTEEHHLDHPGYAKFLETVKSNELNQVKARITDSNGGVDIRQKEEVILLRSTKSGLRLLRDDVKKLLRNIEYDKQELKKHGLVRFLRSELFRSERSRIEKRNKAVVWIDGEEGDDEDEGRPDSDRRFLAGTATSTKLGDYRVRNSSSKRICLYTGDICRHNVDVIVNAANENLEHVGGLARHISQCAGSSLQQECRRYIHEHKKLPTGNAMYTSAGRLSSTRHVVHAVGPRWPHETRDSIAIRRVENDLESAVKSSLELADQLKCKTIAFPAISSGVYGCPIDFVAKQILRTTSNFMTESLSTSLEEVHVVIREEETDKIRCFKERMKRDLDPIAGSTTRTRSAVFQAANTIDRFETTAPVEPKSVSRFRPATQSLQVTVKSGDLSTEDCDAIINSTNNSMNMDSAMASKVLSRKAGPGLQSECTAYVNDNGTLPSGGIYTSDGHNLSCQYVVHVNCPNSPQGLAKAVEDCLSESRRLGVRSVSFPALGTGRMGMADVVAAKAMFDGIDKFDSNGSSPIANVNLVIFDKPKLPAFQQEQANRASLGADDGDDIVSLSGKIQLSNGTIVSLEQGDVTSDSSDVIVSPTGVVYSAVARKSPQTNNDLSAKYSGTPNPVADLSAGGQLCCRRVYAISVPSRSRSSSDDQCIRTIQNIVGQCLNLANVSGYSSIAIPAIGTGGLGYSNRHTAAAVIEASKAFAAKSPSPSLRHIKISVFDAHRISDFQQELQTRATGRKGGFLQKVASGFRSIGSAVGSLFGSGQESAKPRRKRRILKSFSAGEEDLASIAVFATSRSTCGSVHAMLREVINRFCVIIPEDIEKVPEGFDASELKTIAAKSGVALKFDVQSSREGMAKLTLSGFKEDVTAVHTTVLKRLNKALKEEADAAIKERILEKGRWCWQEDDGSFKPYSDEATVKIETAREAGESTVKISHNGVEYEVDIVNLVQKASGRKTRKITREDKFQQSQSGALPSSWTDPGSGKKDYELHMHNLLPSDMEYRTVHQAFTSSGGPGTVVSIERVQNPKIYRKYCQQKEDIRKRRQNEISSGSATLEVMAFHGTQESSIDQIVSNGFNRSYAGSAAGTAYGHGVYFARHAQLSSGYSPAGANQKRKMFCCEVLLGLTTVGNSSMLEPPVINSAVSATDKYDATVNAVASPTIYVSCYRDYMAYPTYLITFQ